MKRHLWLVVGAFAGWLWSCGSSDDGPKAAAVAVTMLEACEQLATARCQTVERCSPLRMRIIHGDLAACAAHERASCAHTASLPGIAFDGNGVSACAAELQGLSCDDYNARIELPLCSVAPGTIALGASCVDAYQCQSRSCSRRTGQACGQCIVRAEEQGECTTALDCPEGLTCAGYKCKKAAGAGDTCNDEASCSGFLLCNQGTCVASKQEQEACQPGECSSVLGLDCVGSPAQCKAIALADEGEACGLIDGQKVFCSANGSCAGYPTGTCKAAVPEERPCDATYGPQCEPPAECMGGWCKIPSDDSCGD